MQSTSVLQKVAALAVLTCASLSANAALTDLGSLDATFPNTFQGMVSGSGSFSDIFTFTLTSSSDLSFSVANFAVPSLYNTILTSASLFSNADNSLYSADDILLTPASTQTGQLGSAFSALGAGSYYLQVTGISTGSMGGLYSGALNVSSVSAVPEPETYAMLLAGLGLIGTIARRRNKKDAV